MNQIEALFSVFQLHERVRLKTREIERKKEEEKE